MFDLPYQPGKPRSYNPPIGLIGCGGITNHHLAAYRTAGFNVVMLCDLDIERARQRQSDYYPQAEVATDYADVLAREDIEVVDIATHPSERPAIIRAALSARKHVLSQKPFVLDLADGQRLVELADQQNVRLAVNQNGRWAPHFSYAREAVQRGLIGDVMGVHMSVHWDHSWVEQTAFNAVRHLILYDYAIHWFDLLTCLLEGQSARRVFASISRTSSQTADPPLLGQALIEYDNAQATLAFDGATRFGRQDRTFIAGSLGSISSVGTGTRDQTLTLTTNEAIWQPTLVGSWFPDGFRGTMGELLCAIEDNRAPTIDAAGNLDSLAVCFAATASADRHEPVVPGTVTNCPD